MAPPIHEALRRDIRLVAGACPTCGRGAPMSLAGEIGVGYSTLNRFLTGKRAVSTAAQDRIITYLDARIHEQLEGEAG